MTINPAVPAAAIVAELVQVTGLGYAGAGEPTEPPAQVNAWLTLDAWLINDLTAGLIEHRITFLVTFAYALDLVDGQGTVEYDLMRLCGEFVGRMGPRRRDKLGGTVLFLDEPDFSRATNPEYQMHSGQEQRRYPVLLHVTMRDQF